MPCPAPEIAILQHLDLMQGAVPLTNNRVPRLGSLLNAELPSALAAALKLRFVRVDSPPKALTWTS